MTTVSRRGFLSLLTGAAALAVVPRAVQAALIEPPAPPLALPEKFYVERCVLPFGSGLIEPGRIELVELTPQLIFRPDRLLLMAGANEMELLHLSARGEPVVEDGVSCDMFGPTAFGVRMPFEAVPPGCRVVLAFRNHSKAPARVNGCFMGNVVRAGEAPPRPLPTRDGLSWRPDDDDEDTLS